MALKNGSRVVKAFQVFCLSGRVCFCRHSQHTVLQLLFWCYLQLQRERENVKTEIKEEKKREKKEKKREKKAKRRAQKGKEKPTDTGDGKIIKLNYDKYDLPEQSRAGGYFQTSIEDEAEPLEYSGLTEEHEQPIRSPNVSSESTWTGNKRKRDTSPTGSIRVHGEFGFCLKLLKDCFADV